MNNTCNPNIENWSDSNLMNFEPTTVTTTPSTVTTTTSLLTTTITNFYGNSCRNEKVLPIKSYALETVDDWGVVFKRGVTYAGGTVLDGISAFPELSKSYRINVAPYQDNPAYKIDNIFNLSESFYCVAKPMQSVTCKYIAYKAFIEVGYTINWQNASPSRGTYKGQGWKVVMRETVNSL